ncbi:MAG: hypothetical protein SPI97_05625, partial [Oscillospiraceae bacterium]|nr:hypothetical protein [Oscillospiraceae bacterium]
MKTKIKQILAGLLVAVMLFGSAPLEALTGIDFGSLFEVKAEAVNISSDGSKATGVLPNEPLYFQTRSSYTFWERLKSFFGGKPNVKGDFVVRVFADGESLERMALGHSFNVTVYKLLNGEYKKVQFLELKAYDQGHDGSYYLADKTIGTANYHFCPTGFGAKYKIVIDDSPLKDASLNGELKASSFSFEAKNKDVKFIPASKSNEPIVTSVIVPGSGNKEMKITESVKIVPSDSVSTNAIEFSEISVPISAKILNPDRINIKKYGYVIFPANDFNNYYSNTLGRNTTGNNFEIKATIKNGSQGKVTIKPDTYYKYYFWAETDAGYAQGAIRSFKTPLIKPYKTSITSIKTIDYRTKSEIN